MPDLADGDGGSGDDCAIGHHVRARGDQGGIAHPPVPRPKDQPGVVRAAHARTKCPGSQDDYRVARATKGERRGGRPRRSSRTQSGRIRRGGGHHRVEEVAAHKHGAGRCRVELSMKREGGLPPRQRTQSRGKWRTLRSVDSSHISTCGVYLKVLVDSLDLSRSEHDVTSPSRH